MAATTVGAAHLEQACQDAIKLLNTLNEEGKIAEPGALFKYKRPLAGLLEECQGLAFIESIKAGVGLGMNRGRGFLISYDKGSGKWSAPCFITYTSAKAGAVLGVEKVSTLMVCISRAVPDKLKSGEMVIEGDINAQIWPLQTPATKAEERFAFVTFSDVVYISLATGVMVDWSVSGRVMAADEARNAECYGAGTTAQAILSGAVERPSQMLPLYEHIASIIRDSKAA